MAGAMLHAVEIQADPKEIYDTLTTATGLASFWTPNVEAEPTERSVATFQFTGAPVPLRMRIDELEPGTRIVWSCLGDFPHWRGTSVTWELAPAPEGSGTTVLFRHDGWGPDYPDMEYAHVNFTWGQIVARLKVFSENGQAQPFLA
jgi:uncharacterized protein YndB with AHSA1/START domain